MRGVIIHAAKDLRIDEIAEPALTPTEVRVRVAAGGICGSDLHYYHHGGFGTIRVQEPMALGHEFAGTVIETGSAVTGIAAGTRAAVNPSRACGICRFCAEGMQNQCSDMRFMGSAMRRPHVQGGFRETVVVDQSQIVSLPEGLSMAQAALAEPLAVCLHAARQGGPLLGRSVLVTGAGPIGALCVQVARLAGAVQVVVTDVADAPLAVARRIGADSTINVLSEPGGLAEFCTDKGHFDVLFEASGNPAALVPALETVRPGGVIVQLGLGGDMTLPTNLIVAKELQLRGTFRFHQEFAQAVAVMASGQIDVSPLITATLPFARATEAFELASDRSQSMKVQLDFTGEPA